MPQEKIIKSSRQSRDASSVQLFASLWHFLFLCCRFCCCLEHCQALQKQNLSLVKSVIEGTIHCKPGAAELLVQEVYSILTNKRYGWLGTSAATCHQKPIRLLKPGSIRLNSRHQSASQVKLVTQEDSMISVVMEANCRVKTVYCLGCHETLPKRILVWPSMLRQSPENLASMQEKKKYKILTDCQIISYVHMEGDILHCKELLRSSWGPRLLRKGNHCLCSFDFPKRSWDASRSDLALYKYIIATCAILMTGKINVKGDHF